MSPPPLSPSLSLSLSLSLSFSLKREERRRTKERKNERTGEQKRKEASTRLRKTHVEPSLEFREHVRNLFRVHLARMQIYAEKYGGIIKSEIFSVSA
jgi:hypothetical protein